MPSQPTPRQIHQRNVQNGFDDDAVQTALAERLTDLQRRLIESRVSTPWLYRLLRRRPTPARGLYIWGGVGRGKTYLMDLFHDTLPFADKRRLHFHRFMQRVHADLRTFTGRANPLDAVADRFARQTRVLCFDEFYVSDIGDAMILAELLARLFDRGVTLVATSNIEPTKLYENGLQRRRFLPAIDLIERNAEVVHMGGDMDYRLRVLRRDGIYRCDGDTQALMASFQALAHMPPAQGAELIVNDRPIRARYCAEDVVWFDFAAICDGPRSQNDYIELARLFSTVVVNDVPVFDVGKEDQARRFMGLIDEFYDRNVKVLLAAAAPIEGLYRGERLAKEFQRTASRVNEMQSDTYLSSTHQP